MGVERKGDKMKKVVIASILGLFLCGCSADDWYGHGYTNRTNLNKIEIGMTKAEVREIMGKPYQREASSDSEWWLYQTTHSAYVPYEVRYTPIAFVDGKVIGWGRNYWTTKEQKFDVKIDQKIKQE